MLNAQEFEVECSSFDAVAYMIAIIETDLGELETKLQIFVILSEYSNLAHVFSEDAANTLPKYKYHNLCLKTTGTPLFELMYNFS